MSEKQGRGYQIAPQPPALGSGWKLTLLDRGQEVGNKVFLIPNEAHEIGMKWWKSISHTERANWQKMTESAIPEDVRRAYLMAQAHAKALHEAKEWLRGAPGSV